MTASSGSEAQSSNVRVRFRERLADTAQREAELGREGFLSLPSKLQQDLALLQERSSPKDDSHESILGAESILEQYNKRHDDAFNLVAQMAGEAGRQRVMRARRALKLSTIAAVGAAAVPGGNKC